jgi:hypothetical protein
MKMNELADKGVLRKKIILFFISLFLLIFAVLAYKIDAYVFVFKEYSNVDKKMLIGSNSLVKIYYSISLLNVAYLFFFTSVLVAMTTLREKINRFFAGRKFIVYFIRIVLFAYSAFLLVKYLLSTSFPAGTFLTPSAIFYLPLLLSSAVIFFLAFRIRVGAS